MARKRAAKQDRPEGQGAASETTPPEGGKKITKSDAVRAAIAEGMDMPEDGVPYILKQYGLDVTRSQFSTYKSLARKKAGTSKPQKEREAKPDSTAVVTVPKPSANGTAGLADQVEAIKTLVIHLGVEQVVSIARLFSK